MSSREHMQEYFRAGETTVRLENLSPEITEQLNSVWHDLREQYPVEAGWVEWLTTEVVHRHIPVRSVKMLGMCIDQSCGYYIIWINPRRPEDAVMTLLHEFYHMLKFEERRGTGGRVKKRKCEERQAELWAMDFLIATRRFTEHDFLVPWDSEK